MNSFNKSWGLLKAGFRILLPTCRQVTRLQSDALERDLSLPSRLGLRMHLLVCGWCRRYGRQIRFLRQAVQDHPDGLCQSNPQSLSPEARERLKRALRQGAES